MTESNDNTTPPPPPQSVVGFLLTKKVSSAMWLMRFYILFLTVQCMFPSSAAAQAHYFQRLLLANGVVCALRLHQRVPHFQFSRHHLALMMQEDSSHYLLFSLIFMTTAPMTMVIMPITLFALLHACSYTRQVLDVMGPHAAQPVRKAINYIAANQLKLFRFIAMSEIMILPMLVFQIFTGRPSIFAIFMYYKFLTMRYMSNRNPYSRQVFYELRMVLQQYAYTQSCPNFLKTVINKTVEIVLRLAPNAVPVATAAQ